MKFKSWLMLLMAVFLMPVFLMAAAPNQPVGPPSAWDKIKNSAKQLLPHREAPKPLTQRKVQTRPDARASANRAASELSAQQQSARGNPPAQRNPAVRRDAAVRRDSQVQQATAIESPKPRVAPPRPPRKPAKPSLFSREKRPTRTLSQYMAEEKP